MNYSELTDILNQYNNDNVDNNHKDPRPSWYIASIDDIICTLHWEYEVVTLLDEKDDQLKLYNEKDLIILFKAVVKKATKQVSEWNKSLCSKDTPNDKIDYKSFNDTLDKVYYHEFLKVEEKSEIRMMVFRIKKLLNVLNLNGDSAAKFKTIKKFTKKYSVNKIPTDGKEAIKILCAILNELKKYSSVMKKRSLKTVEKQKTLGRFGESLELIASFAGAGVDFLGLIELDNGIKSISAILIIIGCICNVVAYFIDCNEYSKSPTTKSKPLLFRHCIFPIIVLFLVGVFWFVPNNARFWIFSIIFMFLGEMVIGYIILPRWKDIWPSLKSILTVSKELAVEIWNGKSTLIVKLKKGSKFKKDQNGNVEIDDPFGMKLKDLNPPTKFFLALLVWMIGVILFLVIFILFFVFSFLPIILFSLAVAWQSHTIPLTLTNKQLGVELKLDNVHIIEKDQYAFSVDKFTVEDNYSLPPKLKQELISSDYDIYSINLVKNGMENSDFNCDLSISFPHCLNYLNVNANEYVAKVYYIENLNEDINEIDTFTAISNSSKVTITMDGAKSGYYIVEEYKQHLIEDIDFDYFGGVIKNNEISFIDFDKKRVFIVVDLDDNKLELSSDIFKCSKDVSGVNFFDDSENELKTLDFSDENEKEIKMTIKSDNRELTEEYTLTIHRSHTITIEYVLKTKTEEISLKTRECMSGTPINLNEYIPDTDTKEHGYIFNYWMDIEDKEISETTPFESTTIYANATPNEYTVTLNPDGGSLPDSETTIPVTYDSDYILPVPTRTGYSFAGWYDNNTQLTDSEGKSLSIWNIADDTELTAKWTINDYVLSLVNSNSEAGTISGSDTYTYGENVTIRATANEGYSFDGWYNSENTRVLTSSVYTFPMGLSENLTLTAKWNYVELTLNYIIDGEVVKTEKYTLENHIEGLYQYETDGYFYGWYDSKNFSSSDSQYTSTEGLTITNSNTYLYGTTLNTKFDFKYENDGYTITGYRDTKTEIEIPESINGLQVKKVGVNAFEACISLTSIVIPNSVETIGRYAFSGCSSLESITLPFVGETLNGTNNTYFGYIFGASSYIYNSSSVPTSLKEVIITGRTSIGEYAFRNCSSLTSIVILNNVTSIGRYAFSGCSSLKSITLPFVGENGVSNTRFGYIFGSVPTSLKEVIITGGTCIGDYAFSGCSSLTSIVIPDSVTSIGSNAFSGCSSLTFIVIPNSVETIGRYAFSNCSSLQYNKYGNCYYLGNEENPCLVLVEAKDTFITSATISEKTRIIMDYAFQNCSSLVSIVIPNSVNSIGSYAFYNCSKLTSITIPNSVTSIRANAFSNCSSLASVVIPDSVTSIGSNAFSNCSSLASVVIPDSVTSIGSNAFSGCSSLTDVYYNGILEDWCNISLESSTSNPMSCASSHFNIKNSNNEYEEVTEIVIPDTITSIGDSQFYGFNNVTNITIPNSVKTIGDYAFYNCSSLTSIVILNSVTSIGTAAFSGCSSLTSVTFERVSKLTSIEDYAFQKCSSLTSIVIPDSVTSIGDSAFVECSSLTSIVIPYRVTSIGTAAFSGCSSLTSIVIPYSVTSIGDYAFSNCSSLQYNKYGNCYYLGNEENHHLVLVKAKDTSITTATILEHTIIIMNSAFSNCSSLTSIVIPDSVTSIGSNAFYNCSKLTSIVIPNSVTSIGEYAFFGCSSLTSIVIPNSVTSFGSGAFFGCSSLTILYEGTLEDWCRISFEESDSNPMYYASHFYIKNSNNEYEEVTEIVIPDTITSIGDYQFYGFNNVTKITIPNSVKTIGDRAFSNCSSLTSIVIPNGVTSIGLSAFSNCSSLTSVKFESGSQLSNINGWAFYNCSSLTSIVIPDSVTSIGSGAFQKCSSLTSIVILNRVYLVESKAFEGCSSLTIYCEASSQPREWQSTWNSSNRPVYWSGQWSYKEGIPTPN